MQNVELIQVMWTQMRKVGPKLQLHTRVLDELTFLYSVSSVVEEQLR